MTVTMELPATGLTETPRPSLHVVSEESQEAVAAAAALETPPEERATPEEITVRILRNIDDTVSGFAAVRGETFIAHVDAQGDTYIPWQDSPKGDAQEIYLEAEEFEIVEPLADTLPDINPTMEQMAGDAPMPQTEPTTAAAGGCADGETPTATSSDQPATGNTQAEPATPPPAAADPATPAPVEPIQAAKLSPRERYLRDKSTMEERLGALTIEEMKLKEQAKLTKKEREVLAEQLSNLIDGWERGPAPDAAQPEPAAAGGDAGQGTESVSTGQPTAEQSADPASRQAADVAGGDPSTVEPGSDADDQAFYQDVLERANVSELSLPGKLQEKLIESGVESVWALEMLRADISQGKANWPKGIGKAKVTLIEDALMQWMARNQSCWAPGQRAAIAAANADNLPTGNDATEAKKDAVRAADVAETSPDTLPVSAEAAEATKQRKVGLPAIPPGVDEHDPLDDL